MDNCKRPARVPDVNNAALLVQQQAFQFPEKFLMRLKVAVNAVEYYVKTDCPLTAPGLLYDQRLKNFKTEYASLQKREEANDDSTLPVISKTLPITHWFEAFEIYTGNHIGQSGCPLSWIHRETVAVAAPEALAPNQPYSTVHESVEEEMV